MMEYFLSTLLNLSLNRAVITNDPHEFAYMANISKLSMYAWETEKIIEGLNSQVNGGFQYLASLFPALMADKQPKCHKESSTVSAEKICMPTDDSLRNHSPGSRKDKMNLSQKVDLLLHSKEFPLNTVGRYPAILRLRKILTYKMKKIMKRNVLPISRKFLGRSSVAKKKLRFRGRFVKKDTLVKRTLFKVVHTKLKRKPVILC